MYEKIISFFIPATGTRCTAELWRGERCSLFFSNNVSSILRKNFLLGDIENLCFKTDGEVFF